MRNNFRVNVSTAEYLIFLEKDGYDSEVFIPKILNGRITLVNVNKQRRCCKIEETNNSVEILPKVTIRRRSSATIPIVRSDPKSNNNHIFTIPSPHIPKSSNSTKLQTSHANFSINHEISDGYLINNTMDLPLIDDLILPQLVAKPTISPVILNKSLNSELLKNKNKTSVFENIGNMYGSTSTPKINKTILHSNSILTPNSQLNETVTKWRSCLTPIKTYSKLQGKTTSENVLEKSNSPRMIPLAKTSLPDYMRNPTKSRECENKFEIVKSKLIIDKKIKIESSEYIKQLKDYSDTKKFLDLSQTKKQYRDLQWSKSNFLRNPSWNGRFMAKNLQKLYRNGCVDKHQITNPKYLMFSRIDVVKDNIRIEAVKNIIPKKLYV